MNSALVARIFPSRYITADSALTTALPDVTAPRRLAGPSFVSSTKMSSRLAPPTSRRSTRPRAGERADHGEDAAVVFLQRHLDGVVRDRQADRMARRQLLLDPRRQPIEGDRDVVDALRQQLQRVQIAARRLTSAVEDQDIVAQLLDLAEDLRRQHDGSSARRLAAQLLHDAALQDRIHPGGKLVEEDHRRVDHEDLGDLHAAAEAAAQVLHLAVRLGRQPEVFQHALGARPNLGVAQTVEPREGAEVVPHRQKQLDGGFLNHDRDAPPHLERRGDDVVAEDAGGARRRPRERREDAQQRRLAGAIRAEQAEDRTARDVERQAVDGADGRLPAAGVDLDEIADTNGRFGHGRLFSRCWDTLWPESSVQDQRSRFCNRLLPSEDHRMQPSRWR